MHYAEHYVVLVSPTKPRGTFNTSAIICGVVKGSAKLFAHGLCNRLNADAGCTSGETYFDVVTLEELVSSSVTARTSRTRWLHENVPFYAKRDGEWVVCEWADAVGAGRRKRRPQSSSMVADNA